MFKPTRLLRAALLRNPQFRRTSEDACKGNLDILKGAVSSKDCLSLVCISTGPTRKENLWVKETTFMRFFSVFHRKSASSKKSFNIHPDFTSTIHIKICFSIPICAPTDCRQSSTFHMFPCVSCSQPLSWILLALDGEFGVISAAPLMFRNTRLTLSTSPASLYPSGESGSVNTNDSMYGHFNVQGDPSMHGVPVRSAFMKIWCWALQARSPRSLDSKLIETWRWRCLQKSLASKVLT